MQLFQCLPTGTIGFLQEASHLSTLLAKSINADIGAIHPAIASLADLVGPDRATGSTTGTGAAISVAAEGSAALERQQRGGSDQKQGRRAHDGGLVDVK